MVAVVAAVVVVVVHPIHWPDQKLVVALAVVVACVVVAVVDCSTRFSGFSTVAAVDSSLPHWLMSTLAVVVPVVAAVAPLGHPNRTVVVVLDRPCPMPCRPG